MLLLVNSLLEKLKVPGVTWRCPNWVFELQPYCIMVPTPPPSVPEVSTIPLPQTDSIAPRPILRCIGPSQHLGDLSGLCGTIWTYAAAVQHAWSGQQEKGVRSFRCLFCLLSILNYASVDNCCGISWATTAISPQRMTGICPCQGLMYQVKKRTGWPRVNGVATHAYSPRWRHGLPLSGGCQLPQQALPPHLLLISAGGYAPAEWLLMLKRSPGSKISGLPSSTIALPEGSFIAGLVAAYSDPSMTTDLVRCLC